MAKRADSQQPDEASSSEVPQGKGRPTPSRKQAQAANARPLVASRHDKTATKEQRLAMREARERARVGMMQGDERFLPARDKGPQRRFVRDYVDSRFNIGEYMIPLMGLVLIMTFIPNPAFQVGSLVLIWIFVFGAVADAFLLGKRVHARLAEKFGVENVQPGTKFYAGMRSLQMRMLRMPKPLVKRGQRPA